MHVNADVAGAPIDPWIRWGAMDEETRDGVLKLGGALAVVIIGAIAWWSTCRDVADAPAKLAKAEREALPAGPTRAERAVYADWIGPRLRQEGWAITATAVGPEQVNLLVKVEGGRCSRETLAELEPLLRESLRQNGFEILICAGSNDSLLVGR